MMTKRQTPISDEVMENLERQIPAMAAAATRLAYFRAVAADHTLVTAKKTVLSPRTQMGILKY